MQKTASSQYSILYLQGPNLHALGLREPEVYGSSTYLDLVQRLDKFARKNNSLSYHFQSDHESKLIERLYQNDFDGCVCNPAAFTHTSIGLRDAFLSTQKPFIEVHISNIYRREYFRQKSYFADIAIGSIIGLGIQGYELATIALLNHLKKQDQQA